MSAVINVAIPVFAIMLAGYLAGRFRILGESSSEALNAFVYWFALPPVLFLSMASVPVGEIFNWPFIWTLLGGMAIVAVPSLILARTVFRNSLGGTTLHTLTGVFANTGYMGIPLFLAAFGPDGALPAVIATAVNNAVLLGLTILLIELDGGEGPSPLRMFGNAVFAVVRGPLFLAPLAGILWSVAGLGLPEPATNFFSLMGAAAAPCALFAMGLFMVGKRRVGSRVDGVCQADRPAPGHLVAGRCGLRPRLRTDPGRCPDRRVTHRRAGICRCPEIRNLRPALLGGDPCLDGSVGRDRQRIAGLVRDGLAAQERFRRLDRVDQPDPLGLHALGKCAEQPRRRRGVENHEHALVALAPDEPPIGL